jgi:hypothetical protein
MSSTLTVPSHFFALTANRRVIEPSTLAGMGEAAATELSHEAAAASDDYFADGPALDDLSLMGFPFVACVPCARDVLAYAALVADSDGSEQVAYVCSVCATPGLTRWAERSSLDELGLTIAQRPILEPKMPKKKSGCAKGCSSSRAPKSAGGSEPTEATSSGGGCGGSCSCSSKKAA